MAGPILAALEKKGLFLNEYYYVMWNIQLLKKGIFATA